MKKTIKYIVTLLLIFTITNIGKAQNTNTLYFMDNIAERNNINPAFTPNCNFYLDFIFLPNLYMNFGNNNFIFNDFIYNQNGTPSLFLNSQQNIDQFYNSLNPSTEIKFNFGLNILSFGFKVKKHYFTFDMGVNAETYAYMPRDIFKLALYGAQDPHGVNKFDFSTLGIDASLYSKVGLGYMYQINNKWQIGVKAKFLMGYANISTQINQMELGISRQSWTLETDGAIKASLPLHISTNEDGSFDASSINMLTTKELISLLYNPAGIGGAIVMNDQIWRGKNYNAGEVGRMLIGNARWETVASTSALIREANRAGLDVKNGIELFELYDKREELAIAVVNRFYDLLGIGLSTLVYIYNPEAIIIGGGISKRENFTSRVERYMNSHLPTGFRDTAKILTASYRNDGGMIGAYYNFIEYKQKRGE